MTDIDDREVKKTGKGRKAERYGWVDVPLWRSPSPGRQCGSER